MKQYVSMKELIEDRRSEDCLPLLVGQHDQHANKYGEVIITVWCPYCMRYHQHGWNANNDLDHIEHRGAHCEGHSPFKSAGYYIGISPKV